MIRGGEQETDRPQRQIAKRRQQSICISAERGRLTWRMFSKRDRKADLQSSEGRWEGPASGSFPSREASIRCEMIDEDEIAMEVTAVRMNSWAVLMFGWEAASRLCQSTSSQSKDRQLSIKRYRSITQEKLTGQSRGTRVHLSGSHRDPQAAWSGLAAPGTRSLPWERARARRSGRHHHRLLRRSHRRRRRIS